MPSANELVTCRHCFALVYKGSVRRSGGRCPICLRSLDLPGTRQVRKRKGRSRKAQERRLRTIGERDNWTCHLCGQKVELDNATVDHLIPKSQGGTRAQHNVKLAHWECNNLRGDRPVREGRAHVRKVLGLERREG